MSSQILQQKCQLKKDLSRNIYNVHLCHVSSIELQVKDNSHFTAVSDQGIIDMNRNGNSANFFSYVRNDKKSKELFASFLNGILISVICVSSIKFVFNA